MSTRHLEYNFVPPLFFLGNGCAILKFCHYNNGSPLQDSAKVSINDILYLPSLDEEVNLRAFSLSDVNSDTVFLWLYQHGEMA